MRTYIIPYPGGIIDIKIIFLEDFIFKLNIWKDLLLGVLAAIFRLFVLGFWEEILDSISLDKLTMGPSGNTDLSNSSILTMDNGKNPEQRSNAKQESNSGSNNENSDARCDNISDKVKQQVTNDILAETMVKDTRVLNESLYAWAKNIGGYNDMPINNLTLTSGEGKKLLIKLLKTQNKALTETMINRYNWIDDIAKGVLEKNKTEINQITSKLIDIQNHHYSRIAGLSKLESETVQIRECYSSINQFRNSALKELNKAESLLLEEIRTRNYLNKNDELRTVLNAEFTNAKKEFNSQDSYLKAKVGQILNAKKK